MNNYFSLTEFLIDPAMRGDYGAVPTHVADKIIRYHLPILNDIRHRLESPLIISQRSGYRPVSWEKKKGRSGTSQHCFEGKGAVDVTCKLSRLPELQAMLLESDYTRVCWYEEQEFFHCDFKGDTKQFFEDNNGWNYKPGYR